jgi:hypothetical protein
MLIVNIATTTNLLRFVRSVAMSPRAVRLARLPFFCAPLPRATLVVAVLQNSLFADLA